MSRELLPARRVCRTMTVTALNQSMIMSVGYYPDGRPGEVFCSNNKSGTEADALARDAAVAVSMCLQHGVQLETLAKAVTRERDGSASSLMGKLLDKLIEDQKADE